MLDAEIVRSDEGCIVWECPRCLRVGVESASSKICRCLPCDEGSSGNDGLIIVRLPQWAVQTILAAR